MYKRLLNFPKLILFGLFLILLGSLYFSKNFKLDASADTLLLENDPDLKYLREVNERRSEEHTSELQSRSDLVCRLLLEKKKKQQILYT